MIQRDCLVDSHSSMKQALCLYYQLQPQDVFVAINFNPCMKFELENEGGVSPPALLLASGVGHFCLMHHGSLSLEEIQHCYPFSCSWLTWEWLEDTAIFSFSLFWDGRWRLAFCASRPFALCALVSNRSVSGTNSLQSCSSCSISTFKTSQKTFHTIYIVLIIYQGSVNVMVWYTNV